jgi:hypothetical protein
VVVSAVSLMLGCSEEPNTPLENPKPSQDVPQKSTLSGLRIVLRPEQPTSSDCIRALAQGQPSRSEYQWRVNGELISEQTGGKLCSEFFSRDDEVSVTLEGTQGTAGSSVIIGNSPPEILNATLTENRILRRKDLTVTAVAEDVDQDEIKFRYQWLINGEEDLFHVDETLPGEAYIKGDTLQVRVIPYDDFDQGTTYESGVLTVPNAPPDITSQPPQQFESLEYTYQVAAADPDDEELTFSLEAAPTEMTISATGLVLWPLNAVSAGTYQVRIAVEDPEGAKTTQEFTITLAKSGE